MHAHHATHFFPQCPVPQSRVACMHSDLQSTTGNQLSLSGLGCCFWLGRSHRSGGSARRQGLLHAKPSRNMQLSLQYCSLACMHPILSCNLPSKGSPAHTDPGPGSYLGSCFWLRGSHGSGGSGGWGFPGLLCAAGLPRGRLVGCILAVGAHEGLVRGHAVVGAEFLGGQPQVHSPIRLYSIVTCEGRAS